MQRMISPKWKVFLESLAGILKMSFVAVSPAGEVQAIYNPKPPFSLLAGYPLLERAYRGFFKEIAAHYKPELEGRLIADPLGLPAVVLSLREESYLVLGGCFTQRDHAYLAALQSRLQSLGVSQDNRIWLQMTFLSASDLSSTAEHIRVIYRHLCRTLDETTELGQQMLLLAAVEEINKLMVESLNPAKFNLERILDLVVSSLVILSDAAGAWAFVCQDPGKTLGCYRGQCTDLLGHLQEAWEAVAVGCADPVRPFLSFCKTKIPTGLSVEMETLQLKEASACLGVIAGGSLSAGSALAAFARQLAIALEVASLYEFAQQRFGMLYNSIAHGLIVTNMRGEILLINDQAISILAVQGISLSIGSSLRNSGFYRPIERAIDNVLESGCSYIHQRAILGRNDRVQHIRWDVLPFISDQGAISGAMLLMEDITEQVAFFQAVRDWEKLAAAGEVAAGLAHEIRNPLATAKAAIQFYDVVGDQSKQAELLHRLDTELERMNEILTSFLETTMSTGNERMEPLHPGNLLCDLEALLREEANINEIELVFDLPEDPLPPVLGDPAALKQVFLNIARNAFEAMAEGGRLIISLARCGNRLQIMFCDNGPGIPEEIMLNITRPFFTTKLGGTGLGLSFSSSILNTMGGELQIESLPREGTTVKIMLPCYEREA